MTQPPRIQQALFPMPAPASEPEAAVKPKREPGPPRALRASTGATPAPKTKRAAPTAPKGASRPKASAGADAKPAARRATAPLTTPPDVTIPAPPSAFVPFELAEYRGYFPKGTQLSAIPEAIVDLERFTDYSPQLGAAAPSLELLILLLKQELQWAELRRSTEAFLVYARSMEVLTWKRVRGNLDQLDRVYQAVVAQHPAFGEKHRGLARLLGATKEIGQRGAATRKLKRAARVAEKGAKQG